MHADQSFIEYFIEFSLSGSSFIGSVFIHWNSGSFTSFVSLDFQFGQEYSFTTIHLTMHVGIVIHLHVCTCIIHALR